MITRLATKFVLRVLGSVSDKVPPTICFTWPLWRSMHGRNRLLLRGGTDIVRTSGKTTWGQVPTGGHVRVMIRISVWHATAPTACHSA